MKSAIILFLVSFICSAQCVVTNETDEFTGIHKIKVNCTKTKIWRDSDRINKEFLNAVFLTAQYFKHTDGTEEFFFTLNPQNLSIGTCFIQNSSKVIWLFDDKSTLESTHYHDTTCDINSLTGYYKIIITDLEKLTLSKVSKLRIYTSKGYSDYEIDNDKKEIIQKTFAALKSNLPKL